MTKAILIGAEPAQFRSPALARVLDAGSIVEQLSLPVSGHAKGVEPKRECSRVYLGDHVAARHCGLDVRAENCEPLAHDCSDGVSHRTGTPVHLGGGRAKAAADEQVGGEVITPRIAQRE